MNDILLHKHIFKIKTLLDKPDHLARIAQIDSICTLNIYGQKQCVQKQINHLMSFLYKLEYDNPLEVSLDVLAQLKSAHLEIQQIYQQQYHQQQIQLYCCDKQMQQHNAQTYICTICAKTKQNNKSHRRDIEKKQTGDASYVALRHFEKQFRFMFDPQFNTVPIDILEQVQTQMTKNVTNVDSVRQYLKNIPKGSDYNMQAAYIVQTLNKTPYVTFSDDEFDIIKRCYFDIITLFFEQNHTKQSLPNIGYATKLMLTALYDGIDNAKRAASIPLIYLQKQKTLNNIRIIFAKLEQHGDLNGIYIRYREQLMALQLAPWGQ